MLTLQALLLSGMICMLRSLLLLRLQSALLLLKLCNLSPIFLATVQCTSSCRSSWSADISCPLTDC